MIFCQYNTESLLSSVTKYGLTIEEEGVLSRLRTIHASREIPLPLEEDSLCKLIGKKTKKYKAALANVLRVFFVRTDEGYISEEVMSHAEYVRGKQEAGKRGGDSKAQKTSSKPPSKTPKVLDENTPKTPSKNLANSKIDNINPLSLSSERDAPPTPKVDDVTPVPEKTSPTSSELISVPADLVPDFHAETVARSKGIDLETEQIKFIAHYQAHPEEKRKGVEAWQAQFRKWLCDAACYSADRNRNNGAKLKSAPNPKYKKFDPIEFLKEQHDERGFGNYGETIDITPQCQSLD